MTDALDTPVAGGEYVYGSVPFRHMMEARSVDIIMIDLMRSCGITGFMKIAGMAEAVATIAAVPDPLAAYNAIQSELGAGARIA